MRIISRLALSSCFIVIIITANLSRAQSPQITNVSPTEAFVGTQVSITGSGFGDSQGSGFTWLGTAKGIIVSWSDTQVVATVAPGSGTGRAQVQQNGASSNLIAFTVDTATVNSVSPASAAPGTQVTITGTGFHAVQGSGQVWLGTALGQVNSWGDTQIVATVAANSTSGNVELLQDGLWSNSISFTVLGPPHITQISPNSGPVGTAVTISGSGFGSSESSGVVWIGGTSANVTQWSDTSIQATVANNAVSGVAKVQQNSVWSNATAFRVTSGGSGSSASVTLAPEIMSMVVGDTRSLQALDSNSQPATGLSWSSSDTTIATLSTDDPPIITAIAPGNVTIYAGQASADITVYPGPTLPIGTVQWSYSGDGSGCCGTIYPAVPSETGVADVFVQNDSGNVQAIRSNGTVAWTSSLPSNVTSILIPDFQGGLSIFTLNSIYKLDGMTGQPYPAYTGTSSEDQLLGGIGYPAIHTDGTVFTLDYSCTPDECGSSFYGSNGQQIPNTDTTNGAWVVGIDPSTGQAKFKVPTTNWGNTYSASGTACGGYTNGSSHSWPYGPMIAGDGYSYSIYFQVDSASVIQDAPVEPEPVPTYPLFRQLSADLNSNKISAAISDLYALQSYLDQPDENGNEQGPLTQLDQALANGDPSQVAENYFSSLYSLLTPLCNVSQTQTFNLHLLRVGSDGSSADTVVRQWSSSSNIVYNGTPDNPYAFNYVQSAPAPYLDGTYMITNADQGALISWKLVLPAYCAVETDQGCSSNVADKVEYHLSTSNGTDTTWNEVAPNQNGPVDPVLQLQDGSFVGTASPGGRYASGGPYMVKFDTSGNVLANTSGYYPQMATADGGVVSQDGTFFDANLNITSAVSSLPTQSWFNNAYTSSSALVSLLAQQFDYASAYNAVVGGNRSANGTAVKEAWFPPLASCANAALNLSCPQPGDLIWNSNQDLANQLNNDKACSDAAQQYVFSKFNDANGHAITAASFTRYILHQPGFYDPTRSTLDFKYAVCGDPGIITRFNCNDSPGHTVKGDFADNDTETALTVTPSYPFKSFWRPIFTPPTQQSDQGFGVGIDPSTVDPHRFGVNIYNESALLHEALHGITGKYDEDLEPALGIAAPSLNISIYIKNNVLSKCPTFR